MHILKKFNLKLIDALNIKFLTCDQLVNFLVYLGYLSINILVVYKNSHLCNYVI